MTDHEIIKAILDEFHATEAHYDQHSALPRIVHTSEIFNNEKEKESLIEVLRTLGNTILKILGEHEIAGTIKDTMGWPDNFLSSAAKEKDKGRLEYVAKLWTRYLMGKDKYYLIVALGQLVEAYNALKPQETDEEFLDKVRIAIRAAALDVKNIMGDGVRGGLGRDTIKMTSEESALDIHLCDTTGIVTCSNKRESVYRTKINQYKGRTGELLDKISTILKDLYEEDCRCHQQSADTSIEQEVDKILTSAP